MSLKSEDSKIKTCERCGTKFECKHSVNCWCVNIKVSPAVSSYIQKEYKDCLCKDCLEYFCQNEKFILANK